MRPRNQPARDQLAAVLARRAAVSAASIAEQLGVSIPTLHRLLQETAGRVVATGKARRTRYALRMPLRGELAELPLTRSTLPAAPNWWPVSRLFTPRAHA